MVLDFIHRILFWKFRATKITVNPMLNHMKSLYGAFWFNEKKYDLEDFWGLQGSPHFFHLSSGSHRLCVDAEDRFSTGHRLGSRVWMLARRRAPRWFVHCRLTQLTGIPRTAGEQKSFLLAIAARCKQTGDSQTAKLGNLEAWVTAYEIQKISSYIRREHRRLLQEPHKILPDEPPNRKTT